LNKSNNGYDQFFKKAQQLSSQKARANSQKNNSLQKNKYKAIPWKIVTVAFLGLLVGSVGWQYSEKVEKLVKKIEVNFLGSAVANESSKSESKETKTEEKTEAKNDKSVASAKDDKETPATTKDNQSPNEYIATLTKRQKELDAKEEELKKLEAEIKIQKEELEKKALELDQTRRQISSVLQERIQVDDKKVESLVQVYTNMKPQQAAKIFEDMDEDLAVEIIGRMKKKNAAEIMNLMKPEKAKYYTEKYAGYKRNTQP